MCPDLWITSLLFDLNYEFINGSFAFSPGLIYILKPKTWQKLRQERGVLAVEIPVSAEMVFTLQLTELNLERDKTGDEGKFHDTYIIHISKFVITRNYTLLISNPFWLQRPFGYLLFDIFLFNLYITANRDSTLLMTVMLMAFTY